MSSLKFDCYDWSAVSLGDKVLTVICINMCSHYYRNGQGLDSKGCPTKNDILLLLKYQPSGKGGTRSPPAMPTKSKMAARGPKMAEGVLKGVCP